MQSVAPELMVHLGDIMAEGVEVTSQLELAAGMLAPVGAHIVPGNHDIGDNPTSARLEHYRRILGPDYWCLSIAGWRIIGLNSQLFCTGTSDEEQQFDWLRSQLASSDGLVGLLLHKPLFFAQPEDFPDHDRYVPLTVRSRLLGMLQEQGLKFVVSGHGGLH